MQPVYDQSGIAIYQAECGEVMAGLAEKSIDLILTDPPYQVSNRKQKAMRRKDASPLRRHFGEWDEGGWDQAGFLDSARRLLRPGGSLIAFCSAKQIAGYEQAGLGLEFRGAGVWVKTNPAPTLRSVYQPALEHWVWLVRGGAKPTWNGGHTQTNGLVFPLATSEGKTIHLCQKPVRLMMGFVARHSNPGDLVLDPYLGSGSTLRAAKNLGRRGIGVEADAKYVLGAIYRIGQEVLPFSPTEFSQLTLPREVLCS